MLLQYVFRRKHLQTAETNVGTLRVFAAMSDQSTKVFYVDVVMLLMVVEDQQRDGVQPLMYVWA